MKARITNIVWDCSARRAKSLPTEYARDDLCFRDDVTPGTVEFEQWRATVTDHLIMKVGDREQMIVLDCSPADIVWKDGCVV